MRRLSSRVVATASDGTGVTSSPFRGRSPPLDAKAARTVSNILQRSIPPCACSTKSKSSVIGFPSGSEYRLEQILRLCIGLDTQLSLQHLSAPLILAPRRHRSSFGQ